MLRRPCLYNLSDPEDGRAGAGATFLAAGVSDLKRLLG